MVEEKLQEIKKRNLWDILTIGSILVFYFVFLPLLFKSCNIVNKNFISGWPISRTLPMKCKVLDIDTKQPIKDAIIGVYWFKDLFIAVEPTNEIYAKWIGKTDENGEFYVPQRTKAHVVSSLYSIQVGVTHPFYEVYYPFGNAWYYPERMNIYDRKTDYEIIARNQSKNGVIYFTIYLKRLEHKYKKDLRAGGTDFTHEIEYLCEEDSVYDFNGYFSEAKKLGIKVKYQEIIDYWSQIVEP
ncbi:MAG: hypothetical protein Q7K21_02190, partial [Elusimicrobiota bacterium]|nr:hypothetical protein [Elusimicrobiota bacterium]